MASISSGSSASAPVHLVLARGLRRLGVRELYGLMGDGNLFVADSFARLPGCRYVASSHEAGAVLMAVGAAQATGELGVATVTQGPGVTNAVTPLMEATRSRVPLLVVAGECARDSIQWLDQRAVVESIGVPYHAVTAPENLVERLGAAAKQAVQTARPVVLGLPGALQWSACDDTTDGLAPLGARPRFASAMPETVEEAAAALIASRRPMILVGRGATAPHCQDQVRRLQRILGAPVATTVRARGLFAHEEFCVGTLGTVARSRCLAAAAAADCVVVVGASLNPLTTDSGRLLDGKRIVHFLADEDPGLFDEVSLRLVGGYLKVPGDATESLPRVLDLYAELEPGVRAWWPREPEGAEAETMRQPAGSEVSPRISIARAAGFLADLVEAEANLVFDGGRFLKGIFEEVKPEHPAHYLHTVAFGAIGQGMAQAIGACVSTGRRTVLVTGDGGFALGGLTELPTAARYGCDLVVVVLNNFCYYAEYVQFTERGLDPANTTFDWPSFAEIASSAGFASLTVRSEPELEDAREWVRRTTGPALVEVHLAF